MPPANSEATRVALQAVALVLQAVDLDQVRRQLGARAQAAQRLRDLLAGADEHLGELDRLLHRRLDAVQAELRGGLLGVVDDVVERGRERVAVAGVERRPHPPAPGQPVDDVVGDAIAFLLADLQVLRERGVLGVLGEQVAQQQPAALHVAPGLLDEGHQRARRRRRRSKLIGARILPPRRARAALAFTIFHDSITSLQRRRASALAASAMRRGGHAGEQNAETPVRRRARDPARTRDWCSPPDAR